MKNLILLLSCFIFPLGLTAKVDRSIRSTDQLKVISIKPKGGLVKIGNDTIADGQIISAYSKPTWGKGVDYMIVYNKRTNVKHRFCSSEFAKNAPTIYDAYVKRNSASSKGASEIEAVRGMKSLFYKNPVFYMIEDELYINSALINDSTHYFELTVINGNDNIKNIILPFNTDEPFIIGISYELLLNAGIDVAKQPVRFAITYCTSEDDIPLTNDFWIEYIKP